MTELDYRINNPTTEPTRFYWGRVVLAIPSFCVLTFIIKASNAIFSWIAKWLLNDVSVRNILF